MNPWSYPPMYNNYNNQGDMSQLQQDFSNFQINPEVGQTNVEVSAPIKTTEEEDIKPLNAKPLNNKGHGQKNQQRQQYTKSSDGHVSTHTKEQRTKAPENKVEEPKPNNTTKSVERTDGTSTYQKKSFQPGKPKAGTTGTPTNSRGGYHQRGGRTTFKKKPVHQQVKDEEYDLESVGQIDREKLEKEFLESKGPSEESAEFSQAYNKSSFFDNLVIEKSSNKNTYEMKKIDRETFGTYNNIHNRNMHNRGNRGYHRGGQRGRGQRGGVHRRNFTPKSETKTTQATS